MSWLPGLVLVNDEGRPAAVLTDNSCCWRLYFGLHAHNLRDCSCCRLYSQVCVRVCVERQGV